MKRTMRFLIAAVMLLSLFSCHRRPLTTADYTVRLDINIDRDIMNYEMPRDPEIMRVAFYDTIPDSCSHRHSSLRQAAK